MKRQGGNSLQIFRTYWMGEMGDGQHTVEGSNSGMASSLKVLIPVVAREGSSEAGTLMADVDDYDCE